MTIKDIMNKTHIEGPIIIRSTEADGSNYRIDEKYNSIEETPTTYRRKPIAYMYPVNRNECCICFEIEI